MGVGMWMYICVCVCGWMGVGMWVYIYVCVCVCVCMCGWMGVDMWLYICIYGLSGIKRIIYEIILPVILSSAKHCMSKTLDSVYVFFLFLSLPHSVRYIRVSATRKSYNTYKF